MKPTVLPTITHHARLVMLLTGVLLLLALLAACDTSAKDGPATSTISVPTSTVAAGTPSDPATLVPPVRECSAGPCLTATVSTTATLPASATPRATATVAATPVPGTRTAFHPSIKVATMPGQHAEFYLKISQTARIQPDDIGITFSRVVKDDRCGNCTVSGPLFVEVGITEKGQSVGTFTLDDRYWIGTGNVVIKGYTLSIFDASPEPCGGCKEVTLDDYSVGFTLAKTASPNPATVRDTRKTVLSQQFYLKLHQAVRSQPDNFAFTLLRVIKDERCPTSTEKNSVLPCTWSPPDGAVRVEVAVSQNGQSLGNFQLASGIGYLQADTLLFGDYELMLVGVNPKKQIDNGSTTVTDIIPDDYVVTMYLTKFAAQNAASGTPTPAH